MTPVPERPYPRLTQNAERNTPRALSVPSSLQRAVSLGLQRNITWLRHFGLEHPPLDKDVSDAALWLPSSKESVVERLVEAVQEHQHVLLTGEPGVGKTCTLRVLNAQQVE